MGRTGPGLASVPLQDHPGRHDREDPDRAHGDDERPDGIAGGVRVAVEGLEDEHGAVQEHDQGNTYARERFPVHRQGNGRSPAPIVLGMAAFFGFHMPTFTFRGVPNDRLFDRVVENAKAAERAGFDLVTVMDHLYQIRGIGPETEPMMEAYTTLSALATQTSRVKLGTLVTGVTYRNPALLAKMVTTLDVISKGRAILGIGAAWNEDEHRGYGFEFPPIARRMDRLDEALTIARLMFTEDRPSFEGKYYRIDRAVDVPRPIQPGGPKILVGGGGERRTLRLLVQQQRAADTGVDGPCGRGDQGRARERRPGLALVGELARSHRDLEVILRRRERACPARAVRARGVVGEVEIDDDVGRSRFDLEHQAVGVLGGVEEIAPAAVRFAS